MVCQDISILLIQSIPPPKGRWNRIHLGLWFAEYDAHATLKHKCIAHFSYNQTIKIRRKKISVIFWSQLELKHIKTTPNLLKLEPWNTFSHKVSIKFWTKNGNQTNWPHAMQCWNNTKLKRDYLFQFPWHIWK